MRFITRGLLCSQPGVFHQGHHILLQERGWWCCTARLGGGSSSHWSCSRGVCRGVLHPPLAAHHCCPSQPAPGHAGSSNPSAATTNTSSLVTCSPVFEFLCYQGPCRTGSQYSQSSGWWLTQQPTVWLVERLRCVGWPGSGGCALPLQDCPSIARALFLTCQQLPNHN